MKYTTNSVESVKLPSIDYNNHVWSTVIYRQTNGGGQYPIIANGKQSNGPQAKRSQTGLKNKDKSALTWAKIRADNASIFIRSSGDPVRLKNNPASSERDELTNRHKSRQKSMSCPPNPMSDSTEKRKDTCRLPTLNRWTEVRRKRNILREKVAGTSKKNNHAKEVDVETSGNNNNMPIINDMEMVGKLYTAMTMVVNPPPSSKRQVHNSGRSDQAVLTWTRREADSYKQITKAYDHTAHRAKRQNIFFKRLEEIQKRNDLQNHMDLTKREREHELALERQEKQLKDVREKYNAGRMRRCSHQYVSHKVIDTENTDRHVYGLPEEYGESRSPDLKQCKPQTKEKISPLDRKKKNMKRFGHLFPNRSKAAGRRPRMEVIDTVVISEGEMHTEKKRNVKSVIKEAEEYLHNGRQYTDDGLMSARISKPEDLSNLHLDDEELFEKARQKYHLDLDSDDDESIKDSRLL